MRVVLDTNILVSRFLVPNGNSARIIKQWEAGAFELLVSAEILSECREVLGYKRIRKKYQLADEEVERFITSLREQATVVEPTVALNTVTADPDDNRILECAQAGDADYLVSGDAYLLNLGQYKDIQILSPAVFLAVLHRE